MGCALGKPTGAGARNRRRDNTVTSDGGKNAVKVEESKESEASNTGEVSGNVPATVSRLPRINSLAATQPSWPPWLMEVAGDAIRDWTPRRANTFEKLAKVRWFEL
jgi:cyclin-dependent kinase 12/13/sacsin